MIRFKYGTQEQYDAQIKDNSALYFISDTKRIYRGEELIAGIESMIVHSLPSFAAAIDGVIYIVIDGNSAQMFVKGETEMTSISAEVLDGSITSIDVFTPDMVLTSADDLESADDDSLVTAGAMKNAVDAATGVWEYLDGSKDQSRIYG